MKTRGSFKMFAGETEGSRNRLGCLPKTRKRWNGTIGRLLQSVIETEKHAKHDSSHE